MGSNTVEYQRGYNYLDACDDDAIAAPSPSASQRRSPTARADFRDYSGLLG